nr:outer membrane beta-barrel protein [Verrucomicrobiaceae bacterium]
VGLEHRCSPNSLGVIKGGVQRRDVGGGGDSSNPYLEASVRSQINEQFAIRSYVRYGVEDYARSIARINFEGADTLRLGLTGTYGLSEQLSLNAGVNYVSLGYQDSSLAGQDDVDEDSFNLSVGFRLELSDTMWLNGSYNFETLSSDFDVPGTDREYDRNRINLGINTTF